MSTSRAWVGWTLLVAAALVSGVAAVRPVMRWQVERSAVHDGPWRTSVTTGSADAGIYERAAVAIAGLYALAASETLYYTAYVDDAGAPLDGACDYAVAGRAPPARWWSLTLYGADDYLVENPARIYSRHAGNLATGADGRFVVAVSARAQGSNWLPAPASGHFSLTLRLYQPPAEVYAHVATVALPSIRRGACR